MQKQRMIKMLKDATEAVNAAGLNPTRLDGATLITEGTQNLIGQLILAGAIENSGSLVSDSIDKLDKLALELGGMAAAIVMVAANMPGAE